MEAIQETAYNGIIFIATTWALDASNVSQLKVDMKMKDYVEYILLDYGYKMFIPKDMFQMFDVVPFMDNVREAVFLFLGKSAADAFIYNGADFYKNALAIGSTEVVKGVVKQIRSRYA